VNAIESANMNKETLDAMKKGADVLKGIHGKLCVLLPSHMAPLGHQADSLDLGQQR
jgi:hypothetical protein